MNGYFENGRIYLNIEVHGVFKKNKKLLKAQIDTGYDGHLTLPYFEAFPLGLVLVGTQSYTLADGSTRHNFVCLGNVIFEKKAVAIPIDIHPSGMILIGTQLLKKIEKKLTIDFLREQILFR